MSISRNLSRAALGALTAGAVITLVAPLLSYERAAQAGDREEETTITIATSKDKEATVLKLDPMKPGETKTLTSEAGKPVLVTRTEDGYTLKIGEKELTVKTLADGEGPRVLLPGGKEVHVVKVGEGDGPTMVFTGDDEKKVVMKKHAFAYTIGEGADTPRAADVLEKAAPKSLESLDPRTRGAVEQVLQELLEAGDVLAPRTRPMVWHAKEGEDGER
ncbi:MAG TPA: hypothetical protein P5164_17595, partial [Thermoanaerobaculia bacterium]|nr:hypothetical protein [Thermoanaerobaculia bacterium]